MHRRWRPTCPHHPQNLARSPSTNVHPLSIPKIKGYRMGNILGKTICAHVDTLSRIKLFKLRRNAVLPVRSRRWSRGSNFKIMNLMLKSRRLFLKIVTSHSIPIMKFPKACLSSWRNSKKKKFGLRKVINKLYQLLSKVFVNFINKKNLNSKSTTKRSKQQLNKA